MVLWVEGELSIIIILWTVTKKSGNGKRSDILFIHKHLKHLLWVYKSINTFLDFQILNINSMIRWKQNWQETGILFIWLKHKSEIHYVYYSVLVCKTKV